MFDARIRAGPIQRARSPCGHGTSDNAGERSRAGKAGWRAGRQAWAILIAAGAQHSQSPINAVDGAMIPTTLRLIRAAVYSQVDTGTRRYAASNEGAQPGHTPAGWFNGGQNMSAFLASWRSPDRARAAVLVSSRQVHVRAAICARGRVAARVGRDKAISSWRPRSPAAMSRPYG